MSNVKITKYEIETDQMIVKIEKLAKEGRWIASASSTDLTRQRPTVFAESAKEVGAVLAAELRKMADAIDEGLKEIA